MQLVPLEQPVLLATTAALEAPHLGTQAHQPQGAVVVDRYLQLRHLLAVQRVPEQHLMAALVALVV